MDKMKFKYIQQTYNFSFWLQSNNDVIVTSTNIAKIAIFLKSINTVCLHNAEFSYQSCYVISKRSNGDFN